MKKYIIVSTYPEMGSKNIGDQLITTALIDAIKFVKGQDSVIDIIWREDEWGNIKDKFDHVDAVIFACLAIRPKMSTKEYPYLSELLNLKVPIAVVSSGTSLPVTAYNKSIYDYVTDETKSLLLKLDKQALFVTTRGYLTQQFCKQIGMKNTTFSGDIAFFNNANEVRTFNVNNEIKTIIVSDPHYSKIFLKSFDTLINGLKTNFKHAEIIIALHGNDPLIKEYAEKKHIKYEKIYEQKDQGLNIYDNADLHVGYRVHAHVSSLKRGMYSYLLEQDGRGCDYGLTIDRKISIPSYRQTNTITSKFLLRLGIDNQNVSTSPAEQMIALITQDKLHGFEKFTGLEKQVKKFSDLLLADLNQLP